MLARWVLSESLLGTPMIDLVVQDEHQHGLGRVVYKFCDAFHAYFYVFIPETGEYGWRATTRYKEDLRSKWGDTFRRAWFVLCTGKALIQTTGYVVTCCLLFAYETVCMGWFGVASVLVSANYYVFIYSNRKALHNGSWERSRTCHLRGIRDRRVAGVVQLCGGATRRDESCVSVSRLHETVAPCQDQRPV
ncbi:hypothetical protein PF010_g4455 [Phytophthora fragariae]|uniref:Uncharacterized protein n=1 Tax=Phytophthora fragariae TaxID=53985 RepID=A0A6A3M2R7_9STRA|nr:hypothetical protein PF011_g4408 [Phytophthora fragariae]KAE9128586.1 hypothetical protein PF010_g4455 [Phytophthora fragariae]KAE9244767.1 hypothetical protein PF004_g5541 [Phytophthora fragariae]